MRFFRDEAFLEESSARREAERGTFDPTYLVYTAGKLALLKLRRDWQEQQGGKPSLRAFHDALLAQGSAPFWALRRLMLGGTGDGQRPRARPTPCWSNDVAALRISVRGLRASLRGDSEVFGRPDRTLPEVRSGPVQKLLSSPAIQFKGSGWYITDYARAGKSDGAGTGDKSGKSGELPAANRRPTKSESSSEGEERDQSEHKERDEERDEEPKRSRARPTTSKSDSPSAS